MLTSVISVHDAPFQDSTAVGVVEPPADIAAVELPKAPICCLAVFNSLTSVHAEPFQDSVLATTVVVWPPKSKEEEFEIPPPDAVSLEVFRSVVSVQDQPSHDSVSPTLVSPGVCPPIAKADVCRPAPDN